MSEREIFVEALSRNPADRPSFLDQMCGADTGRRQRVERLLALSDGPFSLLDTPANGLRNDAQATAIFAPESHQIRSYSPDRPTPDPQPGVERAGTMVGGKYTLMEAVGEGGMGTVWLAEQTAPIKRKVAVKLIKAGLDSKQVLARFEAERQALALMDHPNIAKVLDGGAHESRPFFVMELVKGVPITAFCDARRLTLQQRLELFVPVCQAIQHAHQKGVIHRDIKPSNVLVALYDDVAVPKVIDFGVAKATGPSLTEHTLNTGFGGVVGTPQYMSPEQATFNNLDIDTRSDVYSLGVLLYELLAGSPPFASEELKKRGLLEMLRVVREEEPPRPSTKLSTANALPNLAADRGTEPKRLTGLLRSELDLVVMKALEKDRRRRYETAAGFAADVLRYLAGEPVHAHPPTAGYRLKKFVNRHRGRVAAGGLVLLTLVAGIIGTVIGLLEARKHEQVAIIAAADERRAKNEAVVEKQRAVEFRDKAFEALRAATGEDVEKLLGQKKELSATEKAYLEAIARRWQTFARQDGDDVVSRAIRAEGHYHIGGLWLRLDRYEEALGECRAACEIGEALVVEFPDNLEYRLLLAKIRNDFRVAFVATGKWAEAEEQARMAVSLREKLAAALPASATHQGELATSRIDLGYVLARLGRWPETEKLYRISLEVIEKLVAANPTEARFQSQLARVCLNLGSEYLIRREWSEGEGLMRKAIANLEKLVAAFPDAPRYRTDLAMSQHNLGIALDGLGDWTQAVERFNRATTIREKLVADFPAVPAYRHELALNYNGQGILYKGRNRPVEAERYYRKALAEEEKLAADFPTVAEYQQTLGGCYCNVGATLLLFGKADEGMKNFDSAIRTLKPLYEKDPRVVLTKQYLKTSYLRRMYLNAHLRRLDDAIRDASAAIELCQPEELILYRTFRAKFRSQAGQVAAAVAEASEVSEAIERVPAEERANIRIGIACVFSMASIAATDRKEEYAARAVGQLEMAIRAGYNNVTAIKSDSDFDPLRNRPDYRRLMEELEAKYPPPREVLPPPRQVK